MIIPRTLPLLTALLLLASGAPLAAQYEKISQRDKQELVKSLQDKLTPELRRVVSDKSILGRELNYPQRFILARKGRALLCYDTSTKSVIRTKTLTSKEKKELYTQLQQATNVKDIPASLLKKIRPHTMFTREEVQATFPPEYRSMSEDYLVYAEQGQGIAVRLDPHKKGAMQLQLLCTRPLATNAIAPRRLATPEQNYFPIPASMEPALHRELQWDLIGGLSRLLADRLNSCLHLTVLDEQALKKGEYAGAFLDRSLYLPAPKSSADTPRQNMLSAMDQQLASSFGYYYPSLITLGTQQRDSYFVPRAPAKGQATLPVWSEAALHIPSLGETHSPLDGKVLYLAENTQDYASLAKAALEQQEKLIRSQLKQLQQDYVRYLREHPIQHPTAQKLALAWQQSLDTYIATLLDDGGLLDEALDSLRKPSKESSSKGKKKPQATGTQHYIGEKLKPITPQS